MEQPRNTLLTKTELTAVDDKEVTLKAGETGYIPAQQVHLGKTGSEAAKFLSFQIQKTGEPNRRIAAE